MTAGSLEKLGKVLALAGSAHEGEALAALRAARSLLRRNGVDLPQVLNAALSEEAMRGSMFRGGKDAMHLELLHLRARLKSRDREVESLKRAAEAAKKALAGSERERERWQRLAKETMEKLWSIARGMGQEESGCTVPKMPPPHRQG